MWVEHKIPRWSSSSSEKKETLQSYIQKVIPPNPISKDAQWENWGHEKVTPNITLWVLIQTTQISLAWSFNRDIYRSRVPWVPSFLLQFSWQLLRVEWAILLGWSLNRTPSNCALLFPQLQDQTGHRILCWPQRRLGQEFHEAPERENPNSKALNTHSTTQESEPNLFSSGFH